MGPKFLLMVLIRGFLVNLPQLLKFIRKLLKSLANLFLQHFRILFLENLRLKAYDGSGFVLPSYLKYLKVWWQYASLFTIFFFHKILCITENDRITAHSV